MVYPVNLSRTLNYFVSLWGRTGRRGGKRRVESFVLICDPRTDYTIYSTADGYN